ncbi:uncharacterized protein LOC113332348 [Papaver somniferum]|uniref:uncharacterized protein LOC113332348 n=1 Tax=Papaver somniferum TaxID=3469 RepID=UPI000E6FAE96|nr:uncharacterized protein LOC113332348 [Papaver somniferum]
MDESSNSRAKKINELSRQLRNATIQIPTERRSVVSPQTINASVEEWSFAIIGKLMYKDKIDMRTIREEINSLWRGYRNKQIIVMGHNLMLVRLNNDEERDEVIRNGPWLVGEALFSIQKFVAGTQAKDYVFTYQEFNVQFKYLKLEHMNVTVIDEAIGFMGKKISTNPENYRPRYGNTVKARIEMNLKKPLYRGGWWKTLGEKDVWIRYHWDLQPKKICDKCFVIDHQEHNCMKYQYLLHLDSLTEEEYEAYMQEESDVYEPNEDERSISTNMNKEGLMDDLMEESRQAKRMRNSTLNQEPSMNPHDIHVTPPTNIETVTHANMNNNLNSEVVPLVSEANHPNPTSNSIEEAAQNCNGFADKETRNYAKDFNKMLDPDILFLQETKINSDKITRFTRPLNFLNIFYVPSIGRSRGICLLWKDGFELEIIYHDKNMIHCLVTSNPSKPTWLLSCVCGSPYPQESKAQLEFIKNVCENYDINAPWAPIGDLNLTLHDNERNNSNGSSSRSSKLAQTVLEEGFNDLGFHGNPYTCTSNKNGTWKIRTRLDRSLINSDWIIQFPDSFLRHLPFLGSDHCPILLDLSPKNLKFFECWLRDNSCKLEIEKAWSSSFNGSTGFNLDKRLPETRRSLSIWNRTIFGDIQTKIKDIQ